MCGITRYIVVVIKSFRHKGLKQFFETGTVKGIPPALSVRLRLILSALDAAERPQDMNTPGWKLHPLRGNLAGHWAVSVNGNWRMIFVFEGSDAVLVDFLDYH